MKTKQIAEARLRSCLPHIALSCAFLLLALFAFAACKPSTPSVEPETPSPAPQDNAAPTEAVSPAVSPPAPQSDAPTDAPTPAGGTTLRAKYLGILGYGSVTVEEVKKDGARLYRFLSNGEELLFSIKNDAEFSIQNSLFEGYEYDLTLENETVVGVQRAFELDDGAACPVSYTSGQRTLKNLLAAAMQPVGCTLYVYGGGWNWQDDGASTLARRRATPRSWREFFLSQNSDYIYKDESSPKTSYYPFGGWVEYFYAGLDCSGYLGRTLYTALETEDGREGYVFKSTEFAKTLADMALGSYSAGKLEAGGTALQSGDIVSFKGHTYLVLGRCEDGTLVILHSSPTPSRIGSKGGGVQLSALDPSGKGGMALELIRRYTEKYFPEWYSRYDNIAVPYSTYIDFERSGNAGFFRWSIGENGALSDPDAILGMSADGILALLFGE
ncbi:MAG: hypothetical protein IKZ82_09065 [Clostridia bacterium]|nr:hypothetical protein [Clostridia bacterium]